MREAAIAKDVQDVVEAVVAAEKQARAAVGVGRGLYRCTQCARCYDPSLESAIAFDELGDTWMCSTTDCTASKVRAFLVTKNDEICIENDEFCAASKSDYEVDAAPESECILY